MAGEGKSERGTSGKETRSEEDAFFFVEPLKLSQRGRQIGGSAVVFVAALLAFVGSLLYFLELHLVTVGDMWWSAPSRKCDRRAENIHG